MLSDFVLHMPVNCQEMLLSHHILPAHLYMISAQLLLLSDQHLLVMHLNWPAPVLKQPLPVDTDYLQHHAVQSHYYILSAHLPHPVHF